MYHPNKDKKGAHYWGTDSECNRCLNIGITLIDGKIMQHHNRKELYIKARAKGVKPSEVVIPDTYN